MAKNIVICSDGTNNTFDRGISNVTRLIRLLAQDDQQKQVVVYDQGLGTNARRLKAIEDYRKTIPHPETLEILPGPREWWYDPAGPLARLFGLAFGYGFRSNLREMYHRLGELYDGPQDRIYLIGFSRGAFTVRALAGLIHRCGLPGKKDSFAEAYQLYEPMRADPGKVADYRSRQGDVRDCRIYFLGVWDTVKSYGGFRPILLPHLRHNPIVDRVRHALALDEHRSWFNATTWGRLDLDYKGGMLRLTQAERDAIEQQDIEEVWFRGCHSDIGGGDAEARTARIALRWMLGEATAAGLRLNRDGEKLLAEDDPPGPVKIHESLSGPWWLTEYLPRWEIDNSGEWPTRKFRWSRTGRRHPDGLVRGKKFLLHRSTGDLPAGAEYRTTRSG